MPDFSGAAIIVTGASSGIGRCIAVELGRAGAELWLVGRSADELNTTAEMIRNAGGPLAQCAPLDLRERGPLAALIAKVSAASPHLFALINNGGVNRNLLVSNRDVDPLSYVPRLNGMDVRIEA